MSSVIRGIAVAAILAVAFSASAGLGPNGLGPNGLGPNGLGPNGLGPNGLGPNGLGPNGLGPNGLGPNGLGPNGLGPNGLNVNGLDVNGLGPNGLGPNGLPYAFYPIVPSGTDGPDSAFATWFEKDPLVAAQYMKYFTRCAYDANTVIAYQDSNLKAWAWTGQYGFAMASLQTTVTDPDLGVIAGRMTLDESEWVSSCILAHVNVQGTHQYISLRGNPANPEARAALRPTPGELWTMRPSSVYFGNLFDGTRDLDGQLVPGGMNQMAALNTGEGADPSAFPLWNRATLLGVLNIVLGRNCDAEDCGPYTGADGSTKYVIGNGYTVKELVRPSTGLLGTYLADQRQTDSARGQFWLAGTQTDPVYAFDTVARFGAGWTVGEMPHRPLFVGMPAFDLFQPGPPVSPLEVPTKSITSTGNPIAPTQYVAGTPGTLGAALVGLVAGQSLEQVRTATGGLALANPPIPIDPSEAFTAIVHYANPKATPAAAEIEVSDASGRMRDVGTEIWPSTGASTEHVWLQIYPVRAYLDANGNYAMKVRYAGASKGEACSGTKVAKGDGETGTCNPKYVYFDWKHLKQACRQPGESKPICRGELIYDHRDGKWGWFCAYGGSALYACTAADAPELDGAAFVPGKPWCAGADATSFVGVCQ